jgi:hypothetical protein
MHSLQDDAVCKDTHRNTAVPLSMLFGKNKTTIENA